MLNQEKNAVGGAIFTAYGYSFLGVRRQQKRQKNEPQTDRKRILRKLEVGLQRVLDEEAEMLLSTANPDG